MIGVALLLVAASRLDDVYARDPGIFRAWQVLPRPIATGHSDVLPVVDGGEDLFARSSFGHRVCARVWIDRLCKRPPPLGTVDPAARKRLERYGRRVFGRRASDVAVASWEERPKRIVAVTVSRFGSERAARRAFAATGAAVTSRGRSGKWVARTGWLEGQRLLVGVLVSASNRTAARKQLTESERQVRAYVGIVRVGWYEGFALFPLILLLLVLFSARALVYFVVAIVGLVAAVAGLVLLLLLLLFLPLVIVRGRRKQARARAAPAQPDQHPGVDVLDLSAQMKSLEARRRSALLAVTGLVGFGIAALTTSLLPASLVWGSLIVVALAIYKPNALVADTSVAVATMRKTLKTLLTLTLVLFILGLAPISLFEDPRLQVAAVVLGVVVLVEHWRALTPETELGYVRWYEDVSARSTLFLAGAAALTIGAGSLFLASTGDTDVSGHALDKVIGAVGLVLASIVVVHARAARDAAARDRARRRGTPHVLYLRSFGDDKLRVVSPRHQRVGLERLSLQRTELFEDVIARSLSRIGPVVAIARPGSGSRDLGAARDSIVVDDWLDAVRTYMTNAVLVAVVVGTSEGLVQELDSLDDLGLLHRVCVFVPPVDDDEVRRRLEVLGRPRSVYAAWGTVSDDERSRLVALTSFGGGRTVMVAKKRTATAYRAVAEELATRAPKDAS